jgi:hypothetical protein
VVAQRLSSATPEPEARMEAVGYPGLAGAPGSMPLRNSCLVIGLRAVVCRICREMAGHDGLSLCLIYVCRLSGSGCSQAGTCPGNPHGKASLALMKDSGFSIFWAERRTARRDV